MIIKTKCAEVFKFFVILTDTTKRIKNLIVSPIMFEVVVGICKSKISKIFCKMIVQKNFKIIFQEKQQHFFREQLRPKVKSEIVLKITTS